ncbi:uncharacterized protein [Nicotiana sylvestris]|uniref:uncharacterized protein n=1 Tax=Nicotiana sylvestris TaxID=4096 RepID=UPI00388C7C8E
MATTKKVSKITVTHMKRVQQVLEEESITFDDANVDGVLTPHNDALVISLLVHDTNVKQVLIDPGSSVNIILLRVVNEMQVDDKLIPKSHTLSGFDNSSVNKVEDASTRTSNEDVQTDVDSRPDTIQEPEENENIKTTIEELEAVVLFAHWPDRKVYIGTNLSPEMKRKLIEFLKANADYFAWSHSDMIDIPPEVMTHKLNEDPSYPPVKQKKRKQGSFKNQVIQDEVQKLLKIGFIHEVNCPDWLANTVVVPKKNGN